jgi:hypothetical protein
MPSDGYGFNRFAASFVPCHREKTGWRDQVALTSKTYRRKTIKA